MGARPRALVVGAAALAVVALSAAALYWGLRPLAPLADRLKLAAADFDDLPGWPDDALGQGLQAFLKSCDRTLGRPAAADMGGGGYAGTVADWRAVCAAAAGVPVDRAATQTFFETRFRPIRVANNDRTEGLFTGYYEAALDGSRRRHGRYQVPLHRRPADLVVVDLGRFRDDLEGRRIAGRVDGGELLPYPDRAAIETGGLVGRGLEMLWVDDPVDAFFLHIQGSGLVRLDDGSTARIGYAGQNGRPYLAIGGPLIANGAIARAEISMQAIRNWLADNPGEATALMNRNPSYVFFREIAGDGPLGAGGAVLTPGRSLAVDRKWHALGVPVWFDGRAPDPADDTAGASQPLRRLMVTQDTGGAIRGPVRGDVFWGNGGRAAAVAGRMKHSGRLWLLLPIPLADRLAPTG